MLMSGKLSEKRLPDVAGYHTAMEVGRTSHSLSLLSAFLVSVSRNRIGTFVSFRSALLSRSKSNVSASAHLSNALMVIAKRAAERVYRRNGDINCRRSMLQSTRAALQSRSYDFLFPLPRTPWVLFFRQHVEWVRKNIARSPSLWNMRVRLTINNFNYDFFFSANVETWKLSKNRKILFYWFSIYFDKIFMSNLINET